MKALPMAMLAALMASCSRSDGSTPRHPPVKVTAVTVKKEPIRQTREFIGTLNSRRAVLMQSQVSGYISQIPVKAGDKVQKDQALVVIDSGREQAALHNLVALKASRSANLEYSVAQAKRTTDLVGSGVVSQQAAEQANSAARSAEADAAAIDAQIHAQQTQLQYYRVSAPTAGVVSDIPVKVGDFVTPGMRLTTVVQDSALELNVQIPMELAARLSPESTVEILNDQGEVMVSAQVSFVSPNVDPETQLVLLKAVFDNNDKLRFAQYVRTRLVLGTHEGVRIPSTAVQRLAGATFAFLVEEKDGKLLGRQTSIELGELEHNAYEIRAGVNENARLVTVGVEKLYDGAEVAPR